MKENRLITSDLIRAGDDRTLNGTIGDARMDASILTLEEITQHWSNTRNLY